MPDISDKILPKLVASGTGAPLEGISSVSRLQITASSAGFSDNKNSSSTIPKITAEGLGGEATGSSSTIPKITALGLGGAATGSASTLLQKVATGAGITSLNAASDEPVTTKTALGTAVTATLGTSGKSIPQKTASGVAGTLCVGASTQTRPRITAAGTAQTASVGVSSATLPRTQVLSVARQINVGDVVTPENPYSDPQEAWGINYETNAPYRFYRFPANAMCRFKGKTYVSNFAGVYEVTGETDNGQKINSQVTLPKSNFGDSRNKRIPEVYLGVRSTGKMQLKVVANSDAARYYALNTGSDYVRGSRATVGKGLEANYWQLAVANIDGAPFALDSLEFSPVLLKRHGI